MRLPRYRHWARTFGRVHLEASPWAFNRPIFGFYAEQEHVSVSLSYGNNNSDPVLYASLDLSGTRIGRALSEVYWQTVWWQDRRRARDAPEPVGEASDSTP